MKYLVNISPARKASLVYIGRKGSAYIEVMHGQEVELTQDEMIQATEGASGAVTFAPVFVPPQKTEGRAK